MILPVTVIASPTIAIYSRFMRASLLDVKGSDYMRTARAKGISERKVADVAYAWLDPRVRLA